VAENHYCNLFLLTQLRVPGPPQVAYTDTTALNAIQADISAHHFRHMAQVTNSTVPQAGEDENSRRKASFTILPDGKHEHNLVDVRTEVTVSDTLRNLIKGKWQKQQDQNVEEVGCIAYSSAKAS
jgi:hypothetical protein